MTIREALRNSFPFAVGQGQLDVIAISRGLSLDDEFDSHVAVSRSFELCKADVIKTVVMTPNLSEGGVSISFTDRDSMISIANSIYGKYGEPIFGQDLKTVKPLNW